MDAGTIYALFALEGIRMHTDFLAVAFAMMVSGAGQSLGAVTAVNVEAPAGQTEVVITVRGNNPCGAVTVDYGDGTRITHAIVALPITLSHQYTRAGTHNVRAHGNGNCRGDVGTTIQVQPSHVRAPVPERTPATTAPPLAAMDAIDLDGDGRLVVAEWKGTEETFRTIDQNGDGVLSRAEVEEGAVDVFASLDVNGDRRLTTREWRTARQSFDHYDRNGDGFVTAAEFGVSAADVRTGGRRAAAGPRGRPATVVVRASEAWTDTGLTVRAGDLLTFTATGMIRMSQDAADVATPRGARSGRQAVDAPLPDTPAGALIARVGNSAPILIGDQTNPVRMPGGGRLFLGVNDDHVEDNGGMFRVTIAGGR
jgi:hypothetical protein